MKKFRNVFDDWWPDPMMALGMLGHKNLQSYYMSQEFSANAMIASASLLPVASDACWYMYGADPKWYGSPAGTFFTSTRPQAIRFSGTHNRTYFVYGGNGNPLTSRINYYDHDSSTFGTAVTVANNPAGLDAHGNPSLAIDASGYLYVFNGSETSAFLVLKSTNPEDISAWDAPVQISATAEEYPQPLWVGATLYLFFRHTVSESPYIKSFGYKLSTDSGATWSAYTEIVRFAAPTNIYAVVNKGTDNSVHIAWSVYRYASGADLDFKNVFYTYTTDFITWRKRGGTGLTLPMTGVTSDLVYASGAEDDWVLDLGLDSNNNPIILSIIGTRDAVDDNRGTFAFYLHKYSSGWGRALIAIGADHLFDRGTLHIVDDNNIRAYLTLGGAYKDDGGEIQEYRSVDGGATWEYYQNITNNTGSQNNYPKLVVNALSTFELLFGQGNVAPALLKGYGSASNAPAAGFDCGQAGLEIYTKNGGTVAWSASQLTITTSVTGHTKWILKSLPLPITVRYQRIRMNTYALGNGYRFIPLAFTWQKNDLDFGNRSAFYLLWYSAGLHVTHCPSNGGTATVTQLVATAPVANTWYTCELWQVGTSTFVRVVKADGTVIYDGSITTNDYTNSVLYAAFAQYAGASAGTIVGYFDDWKIR